MSSKYRMQVNKAFEFDFTDEDVDKIDTLPITTSRYHTLLDDKSYHSEIIHSDFDNKKYTVTVNNTVYHIDISNALDMKIAEMGFSIGSSKKVNAIKAPMPGLLLDIHVNVDQEVKENDPLLILEAMKMENVILSPRDGIIKSISGTKGDAVDKGQLLIEFV